MRMNMWQRIQLRTRCDLLLGRLMYSPIDCLDVRAQIGLMNAIPLTLDAKTAIPSYLLCLDRVGLSSARALRSIS